MATILKVLVVKETDNALLVKLPEYQNRQEWFPLSTINKIIINKATKEGTIDVDFWIVRKKGLE